MDNRIYNALEEAVLNEIEYLNNLDAGSQEKLRQVEVIKTIHDTLINADKQESDRTDKEFERAREDDRIEIENQKLEMDSITRKWENVHKYVDIGVDLAKLSIMLLAIGIQQNNIMDFEIKGIPRTKAWQLLPALKTKIG